MSFRPHHFLAARVHNRLMAAWQGSRPLVPPWNWLLGGCGAAYARLVAMDGRRRQRTAEAVPCKVISVGNLTVGGTGKTPFTIYLARRLIARGQSVAIISRGYKGGMEKTGGVVSDGNRIVADGAAAGDEPLMLAAQLPGVPVLAGRDRRKSILHAVREFQAEIAILDDGFQHRRVPRELDIVLLDSQAPLGNSRLLPAGPLREPPGALTRAHVLILTRATSPKPQLPPALTALDVPILYAGHRPYLGGVVPAGGPFQWRILRSSGKLQGNLWANRRVFGFSGIARNNEFRQTLAGLGGTLVGFQGFDDHYAYKQSDLALIWGHAREWGADLIATTKKDYARLVGRAPWPMDLAVVGIEFELEAPGVLDKMLDTIIPNGPMIL